jgi:hypothetical protein
MVLPLPFLAVCSALVPAPQHGGSPGGGSCTTQADCNGMLCPECSCINSACDCAGGWSGAHCETPFCTGRSDCSSHGDCVDSSSCRCDAGWEGPRCATKTCDRQCHHGGYPNPECTDCTHCQGAWRGPFCLDWNHSVPKPYLNYRLQTLRNNSRAKLSRDAQYNPLCTTETPCVGWGVDASIGAVRKLPLLQYSYTPANATYFHGRRIPHGVHVDGITQTDFAKDTKHFNQIEDYISFVSGQLLSEQHLGRGGGYSRDFHDVYGQIYQSRLDTSLAVTQAVWKLYDAHMVEDASSSSGYQLQLDDYALEALQGLGPYENDTASWHTFFEYWGTDFIFSSGSGGIIEVETMPSTVLNDHPQYWLESQAKCVAYDWLNLEGTCTADKMYSDYQKQIKGTCYGGNSLHCPAATRNTTAAEYHAWEQGVWDAPTLVNYKINSLTNFILDIPTRKLYTNAVNQYVHEQVDRRPTTGCPPTCNEDLVNGSFCKGSQPACACGGTHKDQHSYYYQSCYSGRQCTVLAYPRPVIYKKISIVTPGQDPASTVLESALKCNGKCGCPPGRQSTSGLFLDWPKERDRDHGLGCWHNFFGGISMYWTEQHCFHHGEARLNCGGYGTSGVCHSGDSWTKFTTEESMNRSYNTNISQVCHVGAYCQVEDVPGPP